MLDAATPAEEPNQIIEPPKPTTYATNPQSYPPCLSASAVSGILSKTAEMKPSPSAANADAGGSFSTGIIEAHVTSESRNTVPLKVSGNTSQSGRRSGRLARIASQTATPIKGN